MDKLKRNKGITLISLIITIMILIILAGISINMILGNEGLLNKAKYAKESYSNAQQKEEIELAKYNNDIDSYITGNRDYVELLNKIENLESKITILENKGEKKLLFSNDNGWYDTNNPITLSESWNNYSYLEFVFSATTNKLEMCNEFISKEMLQKLNGSTTNSYTFFGYTNYYLSIWVKDYNTLAARDRNSNDNVIYYIYGIK